MASSILMLIDPKRYGYRHPRVALLYAVGTVTRKPAAPGSASTTGVVSRDPWPMAHDSASRLENIERALFRAHQEYQRGGCMVL